MGGDDSVDGWSSSDEAFVQQQVLHYAAPTHHDPSPIAHLAACTLSQTRRAKQHFSRARTLDEFDDELRTVRSPAAEDELAEEVRDVESPPPPPLRHSHMRRLGSSGKCVSWNSYTVSSQGLGIPTCTWHSYTPYSSPPSTGLLKDIADDDDDGEDDATPAPRPDVGIGQGNVFLEELGTFQKTLASAEDRRTAQASLDGVLAPQVPLPANLDDVLGRGVDELEALSPRSGTSTFI